MQSEGEEQRRQELSVLHGGSIQNPAQLRHSADDSGTQQTQVGEGHKDSLGQPQSPAWPVADCDPRWTSNDAPGAWQQQTQPAAPFDKQPDSNIDSGDEQLSDHHMWSQYLNPQPELEPDTQLSMPTGGHVQAEAHTLAQSDSEPASQQQPVCPHSTSALAQNPAMSSRAQSPGLPQHQAGQLSAVNDQLSAAADDQGSPHAEPTGSPGGGASGRGGERDTSAGPLQAHDQNLQSDAGLKTEHVEAELDKAEGKAGRILQRGDESMADCDTQPERSKDVSAEDASMQDDAQLGTVAAGSSPQPDATGAPQAEHQLSADTVADAQQAVGEGLLSTSAETRQHDLADHSMADAEQLSMSSRPLWPQPLSNAADGQVGKQDHKVQSGEDRQAQQQASSGLAGEGSDVNMSDAQQACHFQEESLQQEQQPSDVQTQESQQAQQDMDEAQHAQQAPDVAEMSTREVLYHSDIEAQRAQQASDCWSSGPEPGPVGATQQVQPDPHVHKGGGHAQHASAIQQPQAQQAQQTADTQMMDGIQQTAGQAPQAAQPDTAEALEELPVQPRRSKRVKAAGTEAAVEAATSAAEAPATDPSKPKPATEAVPDTVSGEPSHQAEPPAPRATRSAAARNASGKPKDGQRQGPVKSVEQPLVVGHQPADQPTDDLVAGPSLQQQQQPSAGQPAAKRSPKKQPKRRRLTATASSEDVDVQKSVEAPVSTAAAAKQGQQPKQGAVAVDAEETGKTMSDQNALCHCVLAWLLAST